MREGHGPNRPADNLTASSSMAIRRRGISYYCYPRNYWWFYRPYTTANDGYARCMPYFHYPPQAYRGGGAVK